LREKAVAGGKMRYEELEHTADIRLKVYGGTLEELFENAGFALMDTLADLSTVEAELTDEVEATGAGYEEVLINYLSTLLYRYEAEGRVYRELRLLELTEDKVRVSCLGARRDGKVRAKTGIKAVTYHDVQIEGVPGGWSVVVTCDV
jgi:SHS2 domain-containing protein